MQFFGKYDTKFGHEFLTQSYLYFGSEDISALEFEKLIKTQKLRKKNIVGTIILYNPFYYPIGYNPKQSLAQQNFNFDDDFCELAIEKEITLFKNSIVNYPNKIVEIKYLFNLNTHNIDTSEKLISLDSDLEILNTNQLTIYAKDLNYQDTNNFTIDGKFVFFAWGNKLNKKEFLYIYDYAQTIYDKTIQMQKKISYIYKQSSKEQFAIENLQFLHPIQTGRFKSNMPLAIKKLFSTNPPLPTQFEDIMNN
jgi:hypothetical protein